MRTSFPCLVAAVLLATALFMPVPAAAADISLVAGRSTTSDHRWTTVAFINASTDEPFTWHGMHLKPVATLGWIDGRRMSSENLNRNVYVAGAGLRLVRFWHGAFASFQLGYADGRTGALSSGGEFISSAGWQGRHWVAMVRHISNAGIFPGKNLGETMFMVGVRF